MYHTHAADSLLRTADFLQKRLVRITLLETFFPNSHPAWSAGLASVTVSTWGAFPAKASQGSRVGGNFAVARIGLGEFRTSR